MMIMVRKRERKDDEGKGGERMGRNDDDKG